MPTVTGIDISANNGENIDFRRLYRDGVRFVYIKVSEGDYLNPYAKKHANEARAAGLLVGAYDFVSPKPGRTGGQEADFFVKHARAATLLKKGSLRPAADVEVTKLSPGIESRKYHYAFIERLIDHHQIVKPFVYTAKWFWEGVLGAKRSFGCPLWLASYTPKWRTLIPRPWRRVVIHQYTDQGRLHGINGNVDMDVYFGDLKSLREKHTLKRDH